MGIDDDAFLLMLRLIAKKAKSMVSSSLNEVEEAIDWDAIAVVSGPLQGPYRQPRLSLGLTDLRPVRPRVSPSQGRWPCAGHSTCPPDKASPFMRNRHNNRTKPQLSQAEALLHVLQHVTKKRMCQTHPLFYYTGLTEYSIS